MRRRNPIDSNSLVKMGLILGGAYVAYKYILPMIQGSAATVQSVVAPTMIASAPAPAPGMNAPVMLPAIAPPPAGVPAKAGLQSSNGMMNTFNNPNLPS